MTRLRSSLFDRAIYLMLVAPAGCSSASTGDAPAAGGAATAGSSAGYGALPAGGSTSNLASGGGTSVGGVSTMGGTFATGGMASTGGTPLAGGAAATGGTLALPMGGAPPVGGFPNGGMAAGGAPPTGGAMQTGGAPPTGGAMQTGGVGGSGNQSDYPCDGDAGSYDAVVSDSGGTWIAENGGNTVYTGSSMRAAMQAGVDSLSAGRDTKESVLVRGSGNISAGERVSLPSYTVLNVCGTINVTGSGSGDMAPVYARERTDVEVPNLTLTGSPLYGMFFRSTSNIRLGNIDMRLSGGLGIRIDSHGSGPSNNVEIDTVYVEGTSNHGVETYGVDNVTIGTVIARNTGYSGLLLNDTTNAEVGLVDADGAGTGTGYAAFRMANRNGRVGDSYPTNIHVGDVIARGGGRGIFCVSESGGAVIDRVDIANTGNNAILIENCYNVTIAAESGTVAGPGDIRIAARSEFPTTSDVTFSNLTLNGTVITESPCGVNNVAMNVSPASAVTMCN